MTTRPRAAKDPGRIRTDFVTADGGRVATYYDVHLQVAIGSRGELPGMIGMMVSYLAGVDVTWTVTAVADEGPLRRITIEPSLERPPPQDVQLELHPITED